MSEKNFNNFIIKNPNYTKEYRENNKEKNKRIYTRK